MGIIEFALVELEIFYYMTYVEGFGIMYYLENKLWL